MFVIFSVLRFLRFSCYCLRSSLLCRSSSNFILSRRLLSSSVQRSLTDSHHSSSSMVPSGNCLPFPGYAPDRDIPYNYWGIGSGTSANYQGLGTDSDAGIGARIGMESTQLPAEGPLFSPGSEEVSLLPPDDYTTTPPVLSHNSAPSSELGYPPVQEIPSHSGGVTAPQLLQTETSPSDPHCCVLCPKRDKVFASRNTLIRHLNSFHANKIIHWCHVPGCAYVAFRADKIKKHRKEHAAIEPQHNRRLGEVQLKTQNPHPELCGHCRKAVGSWREHTDCIVSHCRLKESIYPDRLGGESDNNNNG